MDNNTPLYDWIVKAFVGLLTLVGFFMKRTLNEHEKKFEQISDTMDRIKTDAEHTKVNYLSKDDFREFKQELRGMFDDLKNDIRALK